MTMPNSIDPTDHEAANPSIDDAPSTLKDRVFERSATAAPKRAAQHPQQAPVYLMVTSLQGAGPSLIYIPAPSAPPKQRKKP